MSLDFVQAGESLANYHGIPVDKHSTLEVKLCYFVFHIMSGGIATFPNSHHNQTKNRFCKYVT